MSILEAILLGVIQGLTEFLPVSSSGHLTICEQLLGIGADGRLFFHVLLHLGTMTAVLLAFRKDITRMVLELIRLIHDICFNMVTFFHNKSRGDERRYRKLIDNNYRKFAVMILASAIPTTAIGYYMRRAVSEASVTLLFPGLGLLVTGILLLVVDFVEIGKKIPKDIPIWYSFIIGVCQGFSVFPGMSRLGTTMTACLLGGFNRKFAVKFSFIMSIPAVLGAAVFEIREAVGNPAITGSIVINSVVGMIFAGAVGVFCISRMLSLVQKKKLRYFAYYCFIVGIAAIVGNFLL